jgi:hypothetical protein
LSIAVLPFGFGNFETGAKRGKKILLVFFLVFLLPPATSLRQKFFRTGVDADERPDGDQLARRLMQHTTPSGYHMQKGGGGFYFIFFITRFCFVYMQPINLTSYVGSYVHS